MSHLAAENHRPPLLCLSPFYSSPTLSHSRQNVTYGFRPTASFRDAEVDMVFLCSTMYAVGGSDGAESGLPLPKLSVLRFPSGFEPPALHRAACLNDQPAVLALLAQGTDVNQKGFIGCSALHLCADLDHVATAAILADKGADLEARDRQGRTPLHYAILAHSQSVGLLLLDCGVKLQAAWDVIADTLSYGEVDDEQMLRKLLQHAQKIAKEAGCSTELLHTAVAKEHDALVKVMIEVGYDVNERDSERE